MPSISPEGREEIKSLAGSTVGDLLRGGALKILSASSYEVSMEWHMGFLLRELCRADADGDGVEDILCEGYCWAIGGSLGYGWTCVLSRTSGKALFQVTDLS